MTFILRLPAILVLFALVALSALGALAATGALTGFEANVPEMQQANPAELQAEANAAGATEMSWIDVGLFAGAAVFFLISAIRLIRRTQGFWTWLLGFACYGGRWAYAQGEGVLQQVQAIDINVYMQPQAIIDGLPASLATTEAQVGVLGIILVVGLFVFICDAADRAHWDRQGA